jgi:hypothetical protein
VKEDEVGRAFSTKLEKGSHVEYKWGSYKEEALETSRLRLEDNIKMDLKRDVMG